MIRKPGKHPVAEEAARDEQTSEPLTDSEAVPDDLAAAAADEQRQAEELFAAVAEERAGYQARTAAIRERHAAELAEAEREVGQQAKATDRRERKAYDLRQHGAAVAHAADLRAAVELAEHRAATLADECEQVTEVIAGLDGKLSERARDRERYEAAVAAARLAGDVSLIDEGRRLLNATVEAVEGLGEQLAPVQARAREIGDGTETGPGELADALSAARTHQKALTEALDELYPHRHGAELRRNLAELRLTLQANGYAGTH
jgi:hypothetical protein